MESAHSQVSDDHTKAKARHLDALVQGCRKIHSALTLALGLALVYMLTSSGDSGGSYRHVLDSLRLYAAFEERAGTKALANYLVAEPKSTVYVTQSHATAKHASSNQDIAGDWRQSVLSTLTTLLQEGSTKPKPPLSPIPLSQVAWEDEVFGVVDDATPTVDQLLCFVRSQVSTDCMSPPHIDPHTLTVGQLRELFRTRIAAIDVREHPLWISFNRSADQGRIDALRGGMAKMGALRLRSRMLVRAGQSAKLYLRGTVVLQSSDKTEELAFEYPMSDLSDRGEHRLDLIDWLAPAYVQWTVNGSVRRDFGIGKPGLSGDASQASQEPTDESGAPEYEEVLWTSIANEQVRSAQQNLAQDHGINAEASGAAEFHVLTLPVVGRAARMTLAIVLIALQWILDIYVRRLRRQSSTAAPSELIEGASPWIGIFDDWGARTLTAVSIVALPLFVQVFFLVSSVDEVPTSWWYWAIAVVTSAVLGMATFENLTRVGRPNVGSPVS
jgi:hypothetical protein